MFVAVRNAICVTFRAVSQSSNKLQLVGRQFTVYYLVHIEYPTSSITLSTMYTVTFICKFPAGLASLKQFAGHSEVSRENQHRSLVNGASGWFRSEHSAMRPILNSLLTDLRANFQSANVQCHTLRAGQFEWDRVNWIPSEAHH